MLGKVTVNVVAASIPINDKERSPLFTIHARYPRFIHAEVMTHRVFSRNARSSRAVPVKTMIEEIKTDPVVPWHWGRNQRGMQAAEECDNTIRLKVGARKEDELDRVDAWLWARDRAVEAAEGFMNADYHKQVVNRLLEPFMWIDTLITSDQWANFLHLRDHPDAEPHIRDLAVAIREAMAAVAPYELHPAEWHLPYITEEDREYAAPRMQGADYWSFLCKISAARCARISYKPFDGDASYERELERYALLANEEAMHASPMEHQARPDQWFYSSNTGGARRYSNPHLAGNLSPGWVQFRKTLAMESRNG